MFDAAKFTMFIAVSWALTVAPGPDMLYVITRGMTYGRGAGMLSAIGVICGILVHTTAAAFGLTLIFQKSVLAFLIVKYVGTAYLVYLGIKTWRDKSGFHLQTSSTSTISKKFFLLGVLSNVLNPKIAIFFLAFLPQFVSGNGQV